MAITVNSLLTTIDDCESANWTLTDGSTAYGDLDDVAYVQGSACLAEQVKATTGKIGVYSMSSAIDMTDGGHLYQWMMVAGTPDTKANGGYRMYLEDSAGNSSTFYVGGSDTAQGWTCFVLDPQSTPDETVNTLDLTDVVRVGIQFKTLTTANGTANNVFWDVVRYGTGLEILSDSDVEMYDIFLVDDDVNNKYGVITKVNGVYFIKGKLIYGDTSGDTISATINNSLLVFTEDGVASTFFDIVLSGSTGISSTLDIVSSVIKASGEKVLLDFRGVDSVTTLSGSTIVNTREVYFKSDSNVIGNVFDSCDVIYSYGAIFDGNTISNSTDSQCLYLDSSDTISNCKNITLLNFSGKYGIYIPDTVTDTITLDNFQSDGSGVDIYWAGTSGTLTVNKSNGTNFSTSDSAGGTVEIVSSVSININVKDQQGNVVADAYVYIDEDLEVVGEIANTQTDENGEVSTSYSGSATTATLRVRKYGYKPFLGTIDLSGDSSTNVTLVSDPQQI